MFKEIKSKMDNSVNFVSPSADGGNFEARFVWRGGENVTIYLSSHSGCVKGCLFCHLTAEGQTYFTHADIDSYRSQAEIALSPLDRAEDGVAGPESGWRDRIKDVYFSFMARGEPLANKSVLKSGDLLLWELAAVARKHGLTPRFCISSMFPREVSRLELVDIFPAMRPIFYYSLYSLRDDVRKKWLPQAISPELALSKLARWHDKTLTGYKIHGAIIKGVNDDARTWTEVCDALDELGQKPSFNLVQYNPQNKELGEAGDMETVKRTIENRGFDVQVKERVGFDVKASCGMFVPASKRQ